MSKKSDCVFQTRNDDKYKATKQAIENAVLDCLILAGSIFNVTIDIPKINYTYRGRTNGSIQYYKYTGRVAQIRFNANTAHYNLKEFLSKTVPHEIAHYIDILIRGRSAHDKQWKRICRAIGGTGEMCTSYDRTHCAEPRKLKRYNYSCGCRTYELTSIRHNRCKSGASYYCKSCNQDLKYIGG